MAAAIVVSPNGESVVGVPLAISGTGWDATEAHTVTVSNPEESMASEFYVTTDGAGAFALSAVGKVTPQRDGTYTITVQDQDDPTKVETFTQKVFAP
jgi:hypothetical protein